MEAKRLSDYLVIDFDAFRHEMLDGGSGVPPDAALERGVCPPEGYVATCCHRHVLAHRRER